MQYSPFKDMRASWQLMLAIFCIASLSIIAMAIAYITSIITFGYEEVKLMNSLHDLTNYKYIELLRTNQIIQSVGMFAAPAIMVAYLLSEKTWEYLYLNTKPTTIKILLSILIFSLILPAISIIGLHNEQLKLPAIFSSLELWMKLAEEAALKIVEAFVADKATGAVLMNYITIAAVPAIVEELLFRGTLQRIFIRMSNNYNCGIWISAFVFSAIHLQFYGFLPRMILGAIFGYITVYSGSLLPAMILHFINNSSALYFEFYKGEFTWFSYLNKIIAPESLSEVSLLQYFCVSILALVSILLLRNMRKI